MKTLRRGLVVLRALLAAAIVWPAFAGVDANAGAASDAGADAALIRAGRALYRGQTAFAQTPTVQGVSLPGAACSQCHGVRGEARREAGVEAPSIQWRALIQPREALGAFEGHDQVLHAIEQGVGRQGQALQAPMPRFTLTAHERRALLAYLRVLSTDADPLPGVTPQRVIVASVLPMSGTQAATGERIRAALAARFDAINAAGGVFGRYIALQVIDGGATAASASLAASAALRAPGDGVFALVGSLLPEPDAALRALLRAQDLPMVATLGVPRADASQPQLSYLLPSITAQIRQLVLELARQCGTPEGAAVLLHTPGAALPPELATALPALQWRSVGDAAELAAATQGASGLPVIAVLNRDLVEQVRAHLRAAPTPTCLGTLAVVSGPGPSDAASAVTEVVALPMPPLADDGSGAPGAALWPVLGDTAARVFAEALARSGRDIDTARFARALDSLHRFQPVAGLSLTFNPTQRHGFDVAYLWRENQHAPPHR